MSAKTFNGDIKRLLRRRNTAEYFAKGMWTCDPAEADTFSDVVEAAETCVRYGLNEVVLALRYETSTTEVFCTPLR